MTASTLWATILVLASIRWIRAWLLEAPPMPERAYRQPLLVAQAAARWRLVLVALLPTLPALLAPSETGWAALGPFAGTRWVAVALALTLAWSYSTYERNRFLGQTHGADRLLLLLLAALVYLHPAACAPLVVHCAVLMRQFEHPRCFAYSLMPVRITLDMLTGLALWPAAALFIAPPPATLVVLLLSITGASYFASGVAKLGLGPWPGWWAVHDRAHYLAAAALGQGWLARMPRQHVLTCIRAMGRMDRPVALATLALELVPLALLTDRRVAIAMLLAWMVMHAVILLVSGINFWKWVVADIALAGLLLGLPEEAAPAVFTPVNAALGAAIMLTYPLHLRCPKFGWLNTRWTSTFTIEAVGESGTAYALSSGRFAPYDLALAQHRLYFLCRRPVVVATYGAIGALGDDGDRLRREIEATRGDPAALEALRQDRGRSRFDKDLAGEFDRFVTTLTAAMNDDGARSAWWRTLAPPRHIFGRTPGTPYQGQEPIQHVRVWHVENWYDGTDLRPLLRNPVREIAIATGSRPVQARADETTSLAA